MQHLAHGQADRNRAVGMHQPEEADLAIREVLLEDDHSSPLNGMSSMIALAIRYQCAFHERHWVAGSSTRLAYSSSVMRPGSTGITLTGMRLPARTMAGAATNEIRPVMKLRRVVMDMGEMFPSALHYRRKNDPVFQADEFGAPLPCTSLSAVDGVHNRRAIAELRRFVF